MKKQALTAFAIDTPYMGCHNQMLGAISALCPPAAAPDNAARFYNRL